MLVNYREAIMNGNDLHKEVVILIVLALFASMLFGSCASSKVPPSKELAETQAAIKQAEQVGAQDYAPLELRAARKKLEQAQKLDNEEKYEEARKYAERAMVDAELAEIKALSGKAQKAVRELKESIRTLQEEINRKQSGS